MMNLNYHIHKSSIECPYCDANLSDDDSIVTSQLEEPVEFECEFCGKTFWAESCIVFNTYSDCKLNGQKHKWVQSEFESSKNVYNCKNCYQYKVEKL
jgi:uncharacterized protein with PIN domain